MDVPETLVRHVARLARLALTDDEVRAMAPQLARILGHVEAVQEVDAPDDPAAQEPVGLEALRSDEPGPTLDRRAITDNAPAHDGAFYVVPRFFEGSDS